MTEAIFSEFVATYCTATGANAGVREHLLANYRVLIGAWKMTPRDFSEVSFRLVAGNRVPNWPREHTEAIGRELDAIRAERIAATHAKRDPHECPVCDGRGLVIVPHPCCIFRGKVSGYYNPRTKERRDSVSTCAVLCTAPKCWAGENARASNRRWAEETGKPKLLTMDQYLERVGYGTEPTVALREWEHDRAEASRRADPPDDRQKDVFRSLVANILARAESWAERGEHRDPAEVDERDAIPA